MSGGFYLGESDNLPRNDAAARVTTQKKDQLPPKKAPRNKNRNKTEACKGCGKEIRTYRLEEHVMKCKKMPNKTPPQIAKCPNCPYTDKDGNLRRHMKNKGKCRVARPEHQRALDHQESTPVHLDEAESETETTSTFMLDANGA